MAEEASVEELTKIYTGNYKPTQQYAAAILLHMILKDDYEEYMSSIREKLGFKINDRNSSKVINWKKKIKQKGYCEWCGSKDNLVAHHIIQWKDSITGRTDINNGMCLCNDCHKKIHTDDGWIEYMRWKYE